jgi:hypothetical protein
MLTHIIMVLISYSVYPLSLCDKKGEYFFDCIWCLDHKYIFKPVMCFCLRMDKGVVC